MSGALEAGAGGPFPLRRPLSLTVEGSGSAPVLRLAGELDLGTIGQFVAALDQVDLDRIDLLLLDLRDLEFLDAAGLRAVLRANDDCRSRRVHLTVIKPRGFARRVFTLTRAHEHLDLVDSGELTAVPEAPGNPEALP